MNLLETGELLARIQVHDNRQVGAVTIEEWQHDLSKVAYADALQVVRDHRRSSTEYLTANHILVGVRKMRNKLADGADRILPPPAEELDPDDTAAYNAWLRGTLKAVVDRKLTPPPEERPRPLSAEMRAAATGVGRPIPPGS